MIIFIEGIDGAGKTTLYNQLCDMKFEHIYGSSLTFEKTINPHDKATTEYELAGFDAKLRWQRNSKDIYIYDRGPISEIVYRMWDWKPSRYRFSFLEELANVKGGGFAIIYCKPYDRDKAWEARTDRERDDVSTLKDRDEIWSNYEAVVHMCKHELQVPVLLYDWTTFTDIVQVCKFINNLRHLED